MRHQLRSMKRKLESRDRELDARLEPSDYDATEAGIGEVGRRRTRTLIRGDYARGARRRTEERPPL
jgi:hypothetical protein